MEILLSNDDGYQAPGLQMLANALKTLGKVTVVAPERNRSASSSALTLDRPLRLRRVSHSLYAVDGTPTDCVHLAVTGVLGHEPDMVIAGINNGPNLGDDLIYSGTVAAAIEGRFLGFPAMAVSLASYDQRHYAAAAQIAAQIAQRMRDHPLAPDTILNINVPDVPLTEIAGIAATRLGARHKSEPVIRQQDPRGNDIYWIGPAGAEQDAGPGTDFYAIANRQVSVTPIQVDLTRHTAIEGLSGWLSEVEIA